MQLAGGTSAFTGLEIIVSNFGERIARAFVPIQNLQDIRDALPGPLQNRYDRLYQNLTAAPAPLQLGQATLSFSKPRIMGVINVTPDSFSDGGDFAEADMAITAGKAMAEAGVDIIDIGGESTRPGAAPVWEGEEKDRILPVITALRDTGVTLSVDTRRASVMTAALEAGVHIINDVSALTYDAESITVAAASGAPVILMHSLPDPSTMQNDPRYDDVLLDIFDYLEARIEACLDAGMDRSRLIVDPGIGFGKTVRHNLALINGLSLFHGLGCAIMIGVSRKRFIGALSREEPPKERVPGSLIAALAALEQGAHILRVHDVAETGQALSVWQGLRDATFLHP